MSRDPNRIQSVIDKLNHNFINSPYKLDIELCPEEDTIVKDNYLLSVVIPARNEFPNLTHTMYSIFHAWEADGFDPKDLEIIIVNNTSTDWHDEKWEWKKPGDKGTTDYLVSRGAFWARKIRIHYDPIAGNHSARNKGAEIAQGKYLFFSDAHMAYRPGFFKLMLDTIDKTGGMFHGTIAWMGAYPPHPSGIGCGYTLKLGEEIKGTWNNYQVLPDKFFYIPALGHCSVGVRRDQFLNFGGYPDVHRSYGGGEFYINMKWWMFGSSVSTHPQAIGYHLASGRGYSWHHDDYIHNVLNIGYALGMDDWLERTYINCLRKNNKELMDMMMAEAKTEMAEDREFIAKKSKKTFNQLLTERPWEKQNIELYGKGTPGIQIFHYSWLELLQQAPECVKEVYRNSTLQKKLADFIEAELSEFIYKKNDYKDKKIIV